MEALRFYKKIYSLLKKMYYVGDFPLQTDAKLYRNYLPSSTTLTLIGRGAGGRGGFAFHSTNNSCKLEIMFRAREQIYLRVGIIGRGQELVEKPID